MDIREAVTGRLQSMGVSEEAISLWDEILDSYQDGGPNLVKTRVRELANAMLD